MPAPPEPRDRAGDDARQDGGQLLGRVSRQENCPLPSPTPRLEPLDREVASNVFNGSAAMVGVCLAGVGLLRIFTQLGHVNILSDDLLAVDAFFFLGACITSYIALRNRSTRRLHWVERLADCLFLGGLVLMTIVCASIVWVFL